MNLHVEPLTVEAPFSFRRSGGQGWIALSGALPTLGGPFATLADHLLANSDLARPAACIHIRGGEAGETGAFLEEIELLLETSVARLEVTDLRPELFQEVGLLILAGGATEVWLDRLLDGEQAPPLAWLVEGNLLLAAGSPAGIFGSWARAAEGEDELRPGLAWLPDALVLPGGPDPAAEQFVREFLSTDDHRYALGLPPDTVLALGPGGEVEVWSEAPPRLLFSRGWMAT